MTLAPDPVLLDVTPSGTAVVTLNKPAERNAMNALMVAGLAEALETLRAATHVRIVFLRGAGEAFCVGDDGARLRELADHTRSDIERQALDFGRALAQLRNLPQLTVALAHGAATGEGLGLIAACDLAVAAEGTRFRAPDVRFGHAPAAIAPFLIEAVGVRRARAILASAMPFDAAHALAIGLVERVVADEAGFDAAVREFGGLSLESAPGAVDAAKRAVQAAAARALDDSLAHEMARRSADASAGEEGREGLTARLGKRPPSWDRG